MTTDSALPVALITGAAKRIGREIALFLHSQNYRVIIHYSQSEPEAHALSNELNKKRTNSAVTCQIDLTQTHTFEKMKATIENSWGRLDLLVNNAACFFATPVEDNPELYWDQLFKVNLKAPYFLSLLVRPYLKTSHGSIINIADIHGNKPLKNYPIYSMTKSALMMMTQSLAKEFAPHIRVNAIAPTVTEGFLNESISAKLKAELIEKTARKQLVDAQDINKAILFLAQTSSVTGEVIRVDCGRSLM